MPDERLGLAATEGPGRKPVPPHDMAGGRLRMTPSLCASPSPAAPPARFERRHNAHQAEIQGMGGLPDRAKRHCRMLENGPLHLQGRSVLQGQTETDP